MPFAFLYTRFPEIAERETRSLTVLGDDPVLGLPAADYSFREMHCEEPGCDCRRVFFYVTSSLRREVEAVVAWGWETPEFYARWMRRADPEVVAELIGPVLNLGSPQSELAPGILKLAKRTLLSDEAYVERVKRHYRLFRDSIDGKANRQGKRAASKKRKRRKRRR